MTFRRWERRPCFVLGNGQVAHPVLSPGAPGRIDGQGGIVRVFSREVEPEDCERPETIEAEIGYLSWFGNVVEYITVAEPFQRLGVATGMWGLAREFNPLLEHAEPSELSKDAQGWIAALAQGTGCAAEAVQVQELSWRRRVLLFLAGRR